MKIKKNGAWENFILPVSVPTMKGASDTSDGTKGLVPQPALGDQEKFLKGDGSWAEIPQPTVTVDEVTNILATTTKAYITGTSSATTNTGTQIFDTGVYLDTTAGTLVAKTFKTSTGIEIY